MVSVGGDKCPVQVVNTHKFLRSASPAFSALTAWAFTSNHKFADKSVLIDSFRYKKMVAWGRLIEKKTPLFFRMVTSAIHLLQLLILLHS